ncbi:hypothetical protein UYO_2127 [Lachnospiraceae bacterium JC7]|nr:hypothetical protein UYO_2127 [Lachnospiraceae bacterium JC7]
MSKHRMVDGKLLQMNKRYTDLKNRFKNRMAAESIPQHIYQMEAILDTAQQKMDALEQRIADYKAFQAKIQELEAYYTSQQWKDDFAMDEEGKFPKKLKRGVLSEDGIYNMLERNKEIMDILNGFDC